MSKENNYKEMLASKLKADLETIMKDKLDKAIADDNDNKYRNLVKTASDIISLLEKTEYTQMYSVWRNTEGERFLTVWLQNGDMDIKDEKIFKICEDERIDTAFDAIDNLHRSNFEVKLQPDSVLNFENYKGRRCQFSLDVTVDTPNGSKNGELIGYDWRLKLK